MLVTTTPLVSVILPTHNRAAFLSRAISSVLGQTYRQLELIVVDDASTDNTPEVVRSFSDPRLRCLRLAQNSRAGAARNAGMRAARGSLLAFQDDDDIWFVQKLERQVAHMLAQPPDVGLTLCGFIRYYGDRYSETAQAVAGQRYFAGLAWDRGMIGDFSLAATPCWLLRREWLGRVGEFDERMRVWEDCELANRLSKVCRIVHLEEMLFMQDRSRDDAAGMSGREHNFANGCQVFVEKHGHEWEPRIRARHLYLVGRNKAMYESRASGRPWLLRALREHPLYLKAWVALALSYVGDGAVQRTTRAFRALRGSR